jgi:DNA-binding transcriptional regulator/RsmH inhibitor MraZ
MNLPAGEDKDDTIRFYSSNSRLLNLDKQGRVGIPKDYLAEYGIDKEAALVGLFDRVEVWNPTDFDKRLTGAVETVRKMQHLL